MDRQDFFKILNKMGFSKEELTDLTCEPFLSEEDGAEYSVFKLSFLGGTFVLKKAKGNEIEVYSALPKAALWAPKLYGTAKYLGEDYILIEYIPGKPLTRLDRKGLTKTLDAIIDMQEQFYGVVELFSGSLSFEESLKRRKERGKYLFDTELECAYAKYLERYKHLERTLCHDDLLPFNVISSENRAVIIDWEIAGILPYPTSLCRLIAHTEEKEDALFYMKDSDRAFAVDYYYEHFISKKGVSREKYTYDLNLFLFYEYCEWIMLGNKYGNTDTDIFKKYLKLAKSLVKKGLSHLGSTE